MNFPHARPHPERRTRRFRRRGRELAIADEVAFWDARTTLWVWPGMSAVRLRDPSERWDPNHCPTDCDTRCRPRRRASPWAPRSRRCTIRARAGAETRPRAATPSAAARGALPTASASTHLARGVEHGFGGAAWRDTRVVAPATQACQEGYKKAVAGCEGNGPRTGDEYTPSPVSPGTFGPRSLPDNPLTICESQALDAATECPQACLGNPPNNVPQPIPNDRHNPPDPTTVASN